MLEAFVRHVTLPLLLLSLSYPVGARELGKEGQRYHLFYSLEYANVSASGIDLWGADLTRHRLLGLGSRAGLTAEFGKVFPVKVVLDAFSTTGPVPNRLGTAGVEVSLTALNVLLGIPHRAIPKIRVSRTELRGEGITDDTEIVFLRDGEAVPAGTFFPLGTRVTFVGVLWEVSSLLGLPSSFMKLDGDYFLYGPAYAELEFLGVEQDVEGDFERPSVLDRRRVAQGFAVQMVGRWNSKTDWSGWVPSVGFDGDIVIAKSGAMMRIGYLAGLRRTFLESKALSIGAYTGGFFWPTYAWDLDFGAAETDFAYSIGLRIEYRR